jgi:hypothetical protein
VNCDGLDRMACHVKYTYVLMVFILYHVSGFMVGGVTVWSRMPFSFVISFNLMTYFDYIFCYSELAVWNIMTLKKLLC